MKIELTIKQIFKTLYVLEEEIKVRKNLEMNEKDIKDFKEIKKTIEKQLKIENYI